MNKISYRRHRFPAEIIQRAVWLCFRFPLPEPPPGAKRQPKRRPLPDHLPREETVLAPSDRCAACGGRLNRLGEDVTEELEYIPGRFVVKRLVRPRLSGLSLRHVTRRGPSWRCADRVHIVYDGTRHS